MSLTRKTSEHLKSAKNLRGVAEAVAAEVAEAVGAAVASEAVAAEVVEAAEAAEVAEAALAAEVATLGAEVATLAVVATLAAEVAALVAGVAAAEVVARSERQAVRRRHSRTTGCDKLERCAAPRYCA